MADKIIEYKIKIDTSEVDALKDVLKDTTVDIGINIDDASIHELKAALGRVGDVDLRLNIDDGELNLMKINLEQMSNSLNFRGASSQLSAASGEAGNMRNIFDGILQSAQVYGQYMEVVNSKELKRALLLDKVGDNLQSAGDAMSMSASISKQINIEWVKAGKLSGKELEVQKQIIKDLYERKSFYAAAIRMRFKTLDLLEEEKAINKDLTEEYKVQEDKLDDIYKKIDKIAGAKIDPIKVVIKPVIEGDTEATEPESIDDGHIKAAEEAYAEVVVEVEKFNKLLETSESKQEKIVQGAKRLTAGYKELKDKNDALADSYTEIASKGAKALEGDIDGAAKSMDGVADGADKAAGAVGGIKKAVKGVGAALKAAGIGILVALAAAIGSKLAENQPIIDAFSTSMNFVGIIVNDLVQFIVKGFMPAMDGFKKFFSEMSFEKFGKAIKDNIVERIESALDYIGYLWEAMKALANWDIDAVWENLGNAGKELIDIATGVDDTFDKTVDTIKDVTGAVVAYTSAVGKQAAAQTKANNMAIVAVATNKRLYEMYDRLAEQQRQYRDDINATFKDRVKASAELHKILRKQEDAMLKNANLEVDAAKKNMDANKGNVELEAKYQEALAEREGVLADIAGKESEYQMSHQALLEESRLAEIEIREAGLNFYELDIQAATDAYNEKVRLAEKTGQDISDITKRFEEEKLQIQGQYAAAYTSLSADAIGGIADMFEALANNQGENAEKMFNVTKALRYSETVINGLAGGISIWTGPEDIYTKIAATVALAGQTAAALIGISQTSYDGGGSGGGTGGSGGGRSVSTPSVSNTAPVTSGRALYSMGKQAEPLTAFVVQSDLEIANRARGYTDETINL